MDSLKDKKKNSIRRDSKRSSQVDKSVKKDKLVSRTEEEYTIRLETEHLAVQAKDIYHPLEVETEIYPEDEHLLVPRTLSFLTIPPKASALRNISDDAGHSGSVFYKLNALSPGDVAIASGLATPKGEENINTFDTGSTNKISELAQLTLRPNSTVTTENGGSLVYLWLKVNFHDIRREHRIMVRYGSLLSQTISWSFHRINTPCTWHWQLCPTPLTLEAAGCLIQFIHCGLGTKVLSCWTTLHQDHFPPNYESFGSFNRQVRDKVFFDMPWDDFRAPPSAERRQEEYLYKRYVNGKVPGRNFESEIQNRGRSTFVASIAMESRTMFVLSKESDVDSDEEVMTFAPHLGFTSDENESSEEDSGESGGSDGGFNMRCKASYSLAKAAARLDFKFEANRRGIEMAKEAKQMKHDPLSSLTKRKLSINLKKDELLVAQQKLKSVFGEVNDMSGGLEKRSTTLGALAGDTSCDSSDGEEETERNEKFQDLTVVET